MISGRPRLMGRLWNSWSILHTFTLLCLCLHHSTGPCYARMWRMMSEESEEVAEVVHLSSSFFHYRRQLQTGSYCVANPSADTTQLQAALDWACGAGQGNVDCSAMQVGGSCYNPNTVAAHASYAFNLYYIAQSAATGSCSFNGLAQTTTQNPSSGSCVFQAYSGSTVSPGTPPSPPTSTTPTSTPPTNNTGTPPSPFTSTPPTTLTPPSNDTGTIFSPPTEGNITNGTTNFAPPHSITLPWLYALCGGILLIALSSKQYG